MLFHSEFRFDFQRLITVIVGEEQASFSVHAHILRQKSPFFEAALSSRWNDKELPTIEMPEDDPAIFNTFVAWAYTNEVKPPSILENDVAEPDPQIMNNWLDLYLYADELQAQEMKNVVIEFFLEAGQKSSKWPLLRLLKFGITYRGKTYSGFYSITLCCTELPTTLLPRRCALRCQAW